MSASVTAVAGEYLLKFENTSAKLGRIQRIQAKGFSREAEHGGFPIFPRETRQILLNAGETSRHAHFQSEFEDGFRLDERSPDPPRPVAGAGALR